MSIDFDQFPINDPIIKTGGQISNVWSRSMAVFFQTLISYLTSGGIFLPRLTTVERDDLQSPTNGQMIYNTTLGTAQYYKAGVWTSF